MSGFQDRLELSSGFEVRIIERLNQNGWFAFPFGQAQLPVECRQRLKNFEDGSRRPSLIRWMPDIITFCDKSNGKSWVALIDAKFCGERPNYSIELSAVETMEIYTDKLYTPAFFVFDDWRVLTPREARQRGVHGVCRDHSRGSGTPFILVAKHFSRPFDEIFPARKCESAA